MTYGARRLWIVMIDNSYHPYSSEWYASAYHGLEGSFQVLLDTFAVKDVPAFRLYRVLCELVTQPADGAFALVLSEFTDVVFAAKDEVRMARHLPHASKSVKIVSGIVGTKKGRQSYKLKMLE